MNKYFILFCVSLLQIGISFSQNDSIVKIDYESFILIVKQNHPSIKQIEMDVDMADININANRGDFDPVLQFSFSEKEFQEKNYYEILNSGIDIKTRTGVSFIADYDNNNGSFLGSQNYTPNNGTLAAGIKVPLGYGMFTDQSRTNLKLAQNNYISSLEFQNLGKNDIIFNASKAFYQWTQDWEKLKLFESFLQLSLARHKLIKSSFIQNDKPAIDTLDSYNQYLNRKNEIISVRVNYFISSYVVSTFLWNENNEPIYINKNTVPSVEIDSIHNITPDQYRRLLDSVDFHPLLDIIKLKNNELGFEARLKREKLKPKLDLKYNFLNEPINNDSKNQIGPQNYNFGVDFKIPIFLRTARNELKMNKIKIEQNKFKFEQKSNELTQKSNAYFFKIQQFHDLINSIDQVIVNYETLLKAERTKFFNGESSIFMINSRENKLLESRMKKIYYSIKYLDAINEFKQISGIQR